MFKIEKRYVIPDEFFRDGTIAICTGEAFAKDFIDEAYSRSDRRYPKRIFGHYEDPTELSFSTDGWCSKTWYKKNGYRILMYETLLDDACKIASQNSDFNDFGQFFEE